MQAERIDVGWVDAENVAGEFAQSIAASLRDMEYYGCAGGVIRHTAPQPNDAREAVVRAFLQGDSAWLWMVDADMVFDKGHVMKLWNTANEHGVKIVSGLAMIWKKDGIPVPSIFYEDGEGHLINVFDQIKEEPHEVAATGLASTLIHRDVFEAMQPPRHPYRRWFDIIPMDVLGFDDEDLAGVDVQFFVRARQLGFKHYINPQARTDHLERIGINHNTWSRFWNKPLSS